VNELTAYYNSLSNPTIDFNENYPRTVVGKMAKTILKPFCYRPTIQRNLPRECGEVEYFTSASCYELSAPATMRVVKRIEECN
jgi:hypothetical protein